MPRLVVIIVAGAIAMVELVGQAYIKEMKAEKALLEMEQAVATTNDQLEVQREWRLNLKAMLLIAARAQCQQTR